MSAAIMPILTNESSQWNFTRMDNTIVFVDTFTKHSCRVDVSVRMTKDNCFDVSYVNTYESPVPTYDMETSHPLYYEAKNRRDECLFEGVIVKANPITFHMINCLMQTEKDTIYDVGLRPYDGYCGEIMRALCELEI